MLLRRYSNIDYVLQKDVDDAVEIIQIVYEKKNEELMMQRWILHYQDQMTFTEFKNKLVTSVNTSQDDRSQEEIMEDVNNILESFRGISV